MENDNLFSEFPPVSVQEWKEKIIKDLKGGDYDKKLVWRTSEGFNVQPFYVKADISGLKHIHTYPASFPYLRGKNLDGNRWLTNERIEVDNVAGASAKAREVLQKGTQSITFVINDNDTPTFEFLKKLFEGIDIEKTPINLETSLPEEALDNWQKLTPSPKGSLFFDPLNHLARTGNFYLGKDEDLERVFLLMKKTESLTELQTLTVDAALFDNSGANIVTSMAFALSQAVFYTDYLTEKGISPATVFSKIKFLFGISSSYFMEIAKFRALRYLWAKIAESYGITEKGAAMKIHAVNSVWNKTLYDPYVNMLRTTTETMSAIIGGADEITTLPFDTVYKLRPGMAERIARNQQLILKNESYLDKVVDIAAGSYYIETLTKKLIDKAWELFLKTEEQGGYLQSLEKGDIQQQIKGEARKKETEIATRKRNILGVNQFPNTSEHLNVDIPDTFFEPPVPRNTLIEPLLPFRGAAAIEHLRYKTDMFALRNKRPSVWMFTYGNLAMRRARAQFAGNFFGCAGFEIIDNNGFATMEEGIEAAKKASPDIVVLCSSDQEYETIALPVFEALKDNFIVVLAGFPQPLSGNLKEKGFEHFIHTRSNILEDLRKFQSLLIKEN